MLVSKVQAKDVWVTLEFPMSEIRHIKDVLDHSEIVFDSKQEPKMEVANAYVQDHFYPLIAKLIEDLSKEE